MSDRGMIICLQVLLTQLLGAGGFDGWQDYSKCRALNSPATHTHTLLQPPTPNPQFLLITSFFKCKAVRESELISPLLLKGGKERRE